MTSAQRSGNLRARTGEEADYWCAEARGQVQRSGIVCEETIGLLQERGEADLRGLSDEV